MSSRSKEHLEAQRNGKRRDLYTCQICGSTINPEGHHIINYQFSGGYDPDNIVTLCRACHKAVHRGSIDIIKF